MVDAVVEKQKKMDEEMNVWARAPDIDRVDAAEKRIAELERQLAEARNALQTIVVEKTH